MTPQHRLRCLLALGYPPNWICEQITATPYAVSRHAMCGTHLSEEQQERIVALAVSLGDTVATTERTGYGTAALSAARRRALANGYLPPAAYDTDDDGNDVNPDPTAVEGVTSTATSGRTPERAALDRLDLLRAVLLIPEKQPAEIARRLGVPINFDRDMRPLILGDLRDLAPSRTMHWYNPPLCRAILDIIAASRLDGDYIGAWERILSIAGYAKHEEAAA